MAQDLKAGSLSFVESLLMGVGGTAPGLISPARTPIASSMTVAAGSTPSPNQARPLISATTATCGQPPIRRVHCMI